MIKLKSIRGRLNIPEGEFIVQSDRGLYYSTDQLGSVRDVLLHNGTHVARYDYDPYGLPLSAAGSPGYEEVDFRYAGLFYHQASGLYLALHRVYDPRSGRWLNRDPIQERGGINLYSYVEGNPVSYVDPQGLNAALAVPAVMGGGLVRLCLLNPRSCGAMTGALLCAITGMCSEAVDDANSGGQCSPNGGGSKTNPYPHSGGGAVTEPVIVVDGNGNAIPVGAGEHIESSPNGDYQQVVGPNGPTGTRYDRGGHRNQSDPNAQGPHGHVSRVTIPDGNPLVFFPVSSS